MKKKIENIIYQINNEPKNIDSNYDKLALSVFNYCYVESKGIKYIFAEIEIYYATVLNYKVVAPLKDVFCHCHPKQGKMFDFYEHYSGFDITIGDIEKGIMGGILIRGLENNNEFIYGPSRAFELIQFNPRLNFTNKNNFKISNSINIDSSNIIKTKRVNLSLQTLKNEHNDQNSINYFFKKARYIRLKSISGNRNDIKENPKNIDDIIYEIYSSPYGA